MPTLRRLPRRPDFASCPALGPFLFVDYLTERRFTLVNSLLFLRGQCFVGVALGDAVLGGSLGHAKFSGQPTKGNCCLWFMTATVGTTTKPKRPYLRCSRHSKRRIHLSAAWPPPLWERSARLQRQPFPTSSI